MYLASGMPMLLCQPDPQRQSMKIITESSRSYFQTCVCLFSLVILAFNAEAHDPGLSSANVTIGDQQIDVLLGFAEKDVESMVAGRINPENIRPSENFAAIQREIEHLAANEFNLFWDKQRAVPNQISARRKDGQNIEISLRFQRPNSRQVRFVSTLVERLPLGHREFLSVKTTSQSSLGEAMLSADDNFLQIELPAITGSPAASHESHSFFAFLKLGIEHILTGYDHLLFLFALMVVCRDIRSILTVITCFTIAHSITLALATLEIVRLPGRIVEPLIAASIAYVGIENLVRRDTPKWRGLITFSFGLVHGLGFADALREFGIGSGGFGIVLPLIGFNVGVEIGQLSVAAAVLPILWQLRRNPLFVRQWVPVCSAFVALAGGYWMVERIIQN
jgi:hydrogenase/urease accessory protein HupE